MKHNRIRNGLLIILLGITTMVVIWIAYKSSTTSDSEPSPTARPVEQTPPGTEVIVTEQSIAVTEQAAPTTFYFVTRMEDERTTSIWEADLTTHSARRILQMDTINLSTPNLLFPEREKHVLNDIISEGLLPKDRADATGVRQNIMGIWTIDSARLLIGINSEIIIPISMSIFGYSELFILDIETGSLTSILKREYHPEILERWGCGLDYLAIPGRIQLNPRQDKFVYTLDFPAHFNCSGSQTYVVDYSTTPAVITEIADAAAPSWSPDGAYLAYLVQGTCNDNLCETALMLLPTADDAVPETVVELPIDASVTLLTTWIDNQTIVLQQSVDSERPVKLNWYDIVSGESGVVSPDRDFALLYPLRSATASHLIGVSAHSDFVAVLAAERDLTRLDSFEATGLFYNGRFPQYLFMNLSMNTVEMLDASLNRSTLDLSTFFPEGETEPIFYVAPGG